MDEDHALPKRDPFEWPYDLSREYAAFFGDILEFARKLVDARSHWHPQEASPILDGARAPPRCHVEPAAGVKMLNTRIEGLARS
jgi:hypothetical protein